jgi:hypothetical protein
MSYFSAPPSWLSKRELQPHVIAHVLIYINAPREKVVELMHDLSLYEELSLGHIRCDLINMDLPLRKDNTVDFQISLGSGNETLDTSEIVYRISPSSLAFIRKIGVTSSSNISYHNCPREVFEANYSQRWQSVDYITRSTCRFKMGILIPGFIGSVHNYLFQRALQTAFNVLANGIKSRAEMQFYNEENFNASLLFIEKQCLQQQLIDGVPTKYAGTYNSFELS